MQFVAVSSEFYDFSLYSNVASLALTVVSATGLVLLLVRPNLRGVDQFVVFLHLVAAGLGVWLIDSGSNAMDAASLDDTTNRSQRVMLGPGLVVMVALPIVQLLVDVTFGLKSVEVDFESEAIPMAEADDSRGEVGSMGDTGAFM